MSARWSGKAKALVGVVSLAGALGLYVLGRGLWRPERDAVIQPHANIPPILKSELMQPLLRSHDGVLRGERRKLDARDIYSSTTEPLIWNSKMKLPAKPPGVESPAKAAPAAATVDSGKVKREKAREFLQKFAVTKDAEDLNQALGSLLPFSLEDELGLTWEMLLTVIREGEKAVAVPLPFKGPLPNHVDPPARTGLMPGVAPSAIDDPVARREYEAAIAENNRKIEVMNRHEDLRRAVEKAQWIAEIIASDAYRENPQDGAALIQKAKDMGMSAAFVQRLESKAVR